MSNSELFRDKYRHLCYFDHFNGNFGVIVTPNPKNMCLGTPWKDFGQFQQFT